MLTAYNMEYRRRYCAPVFSFSSLCCLLAFLSTIFLAFFVPYGSGQFWLKSNLRYEQPLVRYRGEFYLDLETSAGTVYQYSTYNTITAKADNVVPVFVEFGNEDTNFDGIVDVIRIRAVVELGSDLKATAFQKVNLAVGLEYQLNDTTKITMKSGFFTSFNTPAGAGQIHAIGNLVLSQKFPISVHSNRKYLYDSASIFDPLLANNYITALHSYNARNETLEYQKTTLITPSALNEITLDLTLHIPTHQEVAYDPSMQEMLKNGWLQYLYLLIPIYFAVYEIVMWALVRYKVMGTVAREDELLIA
eukprot:TRINITY_DN15152_c0_g2_i1.p1 TRINITY_DN15152_c0_g2~~TRINITY_DN15152_c0_g2_i1.p1  ORF type:complete len:305 (+),score=76.94 TRINITY_DN15152_c0_g2_i1:99-1013(+)